jgi:bifunctional non-homologous end joining protein LigD
MPVNAKLRSRKKPVNRNLNGSSASSLSGIISSTPEQPLPKQVKPMLTTLVDKPFDDKDWLFEVKWDGYRAIAIMNGNSVSLQSRNDKSFNDKFYPIYRSLVKWNMRTVLDGEIVAINQNGVSNFGALQNWRSEADGELVFYLFDVLWIDDHDLRELPLKKRRKILENMAPKADNIRISQGFESSGVHLFDEIKKLGLEGIIAKKQDSEYHENERSADWLKIKTQKRQEVVIGGYTLNEGSSKLFSSLLVGLFKNKKLAYTGKVGTGFNQKTQERLLRQFRPYIIKTAPFSSVPDMNKPSRFRPHPSEAKAVWLKPKLVCEVRFTEMTSDGVMRHPSFEGMRTDKKTTDIVLEKEIPEKKVRMRDKKAIHKNILMAPNGNTRKTLLNPSEETQVRKLNGHELKFTNLSKIYWPKEKLSKRDMLNYYYQAASYILPYLNDRPQSLNRFPNGIKGSSFYQKDVKGKVPDWIETYAYRAEGENRDKEFLVGSDEASLLYMASLGCIEMNPWSSTTKKPDNPSWCIIDLDPDNNPFDQVIEAAIVVNKILTGIGVASYCKTSGSTGLHIYIPLGAKYDYEMSKEFARAIVTAAQSEVPDFTSIERPTANRKGKIYLDFLQNRPQATLAAPYSVRPKPGATVSMPLHWEEVKKGLRMQNFNMQNAIDRIKKVGDIFKPVLGKGTDLKKAIAALGDMAQN